MKNVDRVRWVKSLLSELNLLKCEYTRLSALSGGEKKRLSLAVQVTPLFKLAAVDFLNI